MSRTVNTIVTDMSYTECPRWHEGRLWFSDFYTYRVYSAAEDGGDLRVEADVPEQPSGLGWLPDGRLLIVSMRDRRLLRREADGTLSTHADLSEHVGGHLNDMVVDERGRAFVGEFGFDLMGGAALEPAGLVRVDPDGTVEKVATGLWFPNGSVITGDGTLLVCETFGNRVTAFDIADDGTLTGRRVWATFGERPTEVEFGAMLGQVVVGADGCCLDADGSLWIADAVGGRVVRVREGGDIVEEFRTGSGVFACMLGGRDGRTLFLSGAPDFHEEARKQAREGSVLSVRVDTPRAGRP
ncbi:gluconolactonase [Prauserella marina]|uniref:Sugar lactone lactonase YvrE n=1 Tax=Prauserella marina TaxID=530584 RepID=A0A222VKM1_9PSEU|nr:SMP-30/gluconolactonase/LRE family protein [Prauserella marina]ASR34468.1 gluconolactonase [Prauserella marina]PWV85940.1 sugar lactone lactonase YvrE [Prauserella marina]SDC41833.1 Sugar lactone lactonase YvrE [Prauserella marina]